MLSLVDKEEKKVLLILSFLIYLQTRSDKYIPEKESIPVHPKGDQSWVFIGRTDVEAETPIFWLPDAKSWFIGKDPDAGKDWRQKEKRAAEDKMIR